MTLAAVIAELEARRITLSATPDGKIRYRGEMPASLGAAARAHRDALFEYMRRTCASCKVSRPIMLLVGDDEPVWICARCWCGGAVAVRGLR